MFNREVIYFFISALVLVQPLSLGKGLSKSAKKQIENRYQETRGQKGKTFLVVTRDGIPAAFDAVSHVTVGYAGAASPKVKENVADVEIKNGKISNVKPDSDAGYFYQPGSLLIVERLRIKNDYIELQTRTSEPSPSMRNAPGDLKLYERAKLKFYFDKSTMESDQLEVIFSAIDQWVKPFDDRMQALKYNSSISGPRITLGMTFAEVETMLGLPETKESDGNRVIYRYKSMAVEFIDGRATRYAEK